jgi:putative transposase
VWLQLKPGGVVVARRTVVRLMKAIGLQGVQWGKVTRTMIADPATTRPADVVGRHCSWTFVDVCVRRV